MKRNMDLVRSILLQIEEFDDGLGGDIEVDADGVPIQILQGHLALLKEAGLIDAHELPDSDYDYLHYSPTRLTWRGHEFLDAIRDPDVWRKVKEGSSKLGGAGIDLLWDIAKAYLKEKAAQKLGISLD